MNRIAIAIVAFVLWTVFAGFIGWQVRDGSADTTQARGATQVAQAQTRVVTEARATDHTNARASAVVESKRVADASKLASHFSDIDKGITTYAKEHANSIADRGCNSDRGPDFLRIWNAANSGQPPGAGPGHPAGADAGSAGRSGADHGSRRHDAVDQSRSDGVHGAQPGAAVERIDMHGHVAGWRHDQWIEADPEQRMQGIRSAPEVAPWNTPATGVEPLWISAGSFPTGVGLRGR